MIKKIFCLILFLLLNIDAYTQVGIGTTNPDNSSVLDITSPNKGVLIPRMTVAQRIAIVSPAEALLVYQINDVKGFYFYDGTKWIRLLDIKRDGNPIGTVITFPTKNVPTGYLECNGAVVSRTTYANLFAVIGTNYGAGNGTTTFKLPDYRGRFLRGFNHGSGRDPNVLTRTNRGDGTTGDAVGTVQNNQTLAHHHIVNPPITNTNSKGNHRHIVDPPNTFTTFTGNHRHIVDPPNTATTINGNHRHADNIYQRTGRNSSLSPKPVVPTSIRRTNLNYQTSFAGSHRHTINIAPFFSHFAGNHRHTVNIAPFNSFFSGNHNHTFDIAPFNSSNSGGAETRPKNINVMYCIKY